MDGSHRRAGTLLGTVGMALIVAGPVMLWRGRSGRKEIRTELAAQKITFPERGLPAELATHAGRRVETGPEAHAGQPSSPTGRRHKVDGTEQSSAKEP
ncbi:hypothetical protein [Streptomyces sp. BK239]|uniref:hypothetical protein n=1 Tax=Streptomyces sp. BK239 TaxID=2512155 RepID=UPI00102D1A4E|nr:hypothetical protein [Streptomyces sp. BK239]RZU23732.1 hypothetical protein EV567_1468 [Streptomyces sp. BK239]